MPISKDITPLYSLPYAETTGYLARATVNSVLQGGALAALPQTEEGANGSTADEVCRVS